MSILILEGADGAGKTTLGKKIADMLGFDYVHEKPPPEDRDAYDYYLERAHELSPRTVVDRFHLGERVYPHLFDGRSPLELWQQRHIERVLMARGATLVLCRPPIEQCRKACLEDGESFIGPGEQLEEVHKRFDGAMADSFLPKFTYDWTKSQQGRNLLEQLHDHPFFGSAFGAFGRTHELSGHVMTGAHLLVFNGFSHSGTSKWGDGLTPCGDSNPHSTIVHRLLDDLYNERARRMCLTQAFKRPGERWFNRRMFHLEMELIDPVSVTAVGGATSLLRQELGESEFGYVGHPVNYRDSQKFTQDLDDEIGYDHIYPQDEDAS